MKSLIAASALDALAACATTPPASRRRGRRPQRPAATPTPAQALVGRPATAELGAEALRLSGARTPALDPARRRW